MRHLVAFLLLLGVIVLSPLRAVAATVPMLIANDAVIVATATTGIGAYDAVRPEPEHARVIAYEDAFRAYDDASNRRIVASRAPVHAYDNALEVTERREPSEGVIYGAAAATTAAEGLASNAADAPRLAMQLAQEEAASAFTATGEELSEEAIQGARQIVPPGQLGNAAIPQGFGKYATQTFNSPSGPFQVHFYMNPSTGETFYGLDFKAIFNGERGPTYFQPFTGSAQ